VYFFIIDKSTHLKHTQDRWREESQREQYSPSEHSTLYPRYESHVLLFTCSIFWLKWTYNL